jgi:ribosomal protein S18 acetylase RimI-like enzyme
MAVTQGVQGLGIGKLLLEHCFACQGKKKLAHLFCIRIEMTSAIHLYHKYGCRNTIRKRFMSVPTSNGESL